MSDTWITIDDAATLAGRSSRAIRYWISNGLLKANTNDQGVTTVSARQVLAVEPTVKRGRPVGSARPTGERRGLRR